MAYFEEANPIAANLSFEGFIEYIPGYYLWDSRECANTPAVIVFIAGALLGDLIDHPGIRSTTEKIKKQHCIKCRDTRNSPDRRQPSLVSLLRLDVLMAEIEE